ncbi:sirohydrochlorin cobaltochelatase [Huintestinicola sp.]
MKNLKLILAAMTALCVMTACGGNTDSTADTSAETASETVQAEETEAEEAQASEETSAEETTEEATEEDSSSEEDAEDDENYNTGDASLDNVRNQDEIGENELLAVSFGTSFNDSRRLTIGAIENDLETAFPDYSVRRGFTANIVIDHVQKRDGILIDDLNAALQRAADNGVKNLVIQPTHLMNGLEYDEIVDTAANYSDAFDKVVFGAPLLTSDDDFDRVAKAITDWTSEYDDGETAICFMGHGTEADSNSVYSKMQDTLTNMGFANYYVGTVEAAPSLDDVLAKVKEGNYKRVVLEPLMVVAGDHANNDMAGDEDGSWKTTFENEGYEVVCLLRGLGENEAIRQIYVDHAQAAIDSLNS